MRLEAELVKTEVVAHMNQEGGCLIVFVIRKMYFLLCSDKIAEWSWVSVGFFLFDFWFGGVLGHCCLHSGLV